MVGQDSMQDGKEPGPAGAPDDGGAEKDGGHEEGERQPHSDPPPPPDRPLDNPGTPSDDEEDDSSRGDNGEEYDLEEEEEEESEEDDPAASAAAAATIGGASASDGDEDDPLSRLQLSETKSQRLPTRRRIANSVRPKVQADTLRALFYSLDRSPFLDLLAYVTGCSPDPEAMIEFADKTPHLWANMVGTFARLGGYTEKTESVNTNILVEMGKLSDVELMRMMRDLDEQVRPMIEHQPDAPGEARRGSHILPREGDSAHA